MTCLKPLIELLLTHVRLTPQADVIFTRVRFSISIFVRMEVSGLISGRTRLFSSRAVRNASTQPRHAQIPTLCALAACCARFSCRCDPHAPGPNLELLEPRPGVLSSALYQPGHLVWVWYGSR